MPEFYQTEEHSPLLPEPRISKLSDSKEHDTIIRNYGRQFKLPDSHDDLPAFAFQHAGMGLVELDRVVMALEILDRYSNRKPEIRRWNKIIDTIDTERCKIQQPAIKRNNTPKKNPH